MPYILINKDTQDAEIIGSIKNIAEQTGIEENKLYYEFSRKKEKDFENNSYRVIKSKIKRN